MALSNEIYLPSSKQALQAIEMILELQSRLAAKLPDLDSTQIEPISWLRDEGLHGGGTRLSIAPNNAYNRGSINVSCVHYEDLEDKPLASANAFSTIIHPRHPHRPSMHCHISLTELKNGRAYWRMMADLNPSMPDESDTKRFKAAMNQACNGLMDYMTAQGDRYFEIPVLERHRGVSHYYLEAYSTPSFENDLAMAKKFGETLIQTYCSILESIPTDITPTSEEARTQLVYHTAYLFQVLTLDRGTTSGLLVHDQNDDGILASLPTYVDRELLKSWIPRMPKPQDRLLTKIVETLPDNDPSEVSNETRVKLAQVLRAHYTAHPEALDMQASGDVMPPTVKNHTGQID